MCLNLLICRWSTSPYTAGLSELYLRLFIHSREAAGVPQRLLFICEVFSFFFFFLGHTFTCVVKNWDTWYTVQYDYGAPSFIYTAFDCIIDYVTVCGGKGKVWFSGGNVMDVEWKGDSGRGMYIVRLEWRERRLVMRGRSIVLWVSVSKGCVVVIS